MAYKDLHTVRLALYDYPHSRNSLTSKDSYFKNCYPEMLPTGDQQTPKYYVTQRPGLGSAVYNQSSAEGRGMYVWRNNVYYVVGNTLYKNGSALSVTTDVTLSTSTGRVYWEQMSAYLPGGTGSDASKLFLLAGEDLYSIETSNTVTKHAGGTQANAVLGTVAGGLCTLDGWLFVCDTTGRIAHSNTQNDTSANISFSNANIASANTYSDDLKGIIRHLNYLVAFGEWSTEFFYNAGNTSGSVLSRAEGTVLRYGTPNFATLWQDENILCWVARSRDGGNCVMVLDGLTPKIVSTKPIEKILNAESDITDAYAYGVRIAGHIFYILNLPNADKTLVFSLTDNMWCEWTSYDGATETYFKIADIKGYISSSGSTNFYALHVSNGDIYPLDITYYQDVGQTIKTKIVTDKIDFGTNARKFLSSMYLLGDLIDNGSAVNISMRFTDDDYKTWCDTLTSDMRYTPSWKALGSFSRRAFEFTFEQNQPMRLESVEFGLKLGKYAQGSL